MVNERVILEGKLPFKEGARPYPHFISIDLYLYQSNIKYPFNIPIIKKRFQFMMLINIAILTY